MPLNITIQVRPVSQPPAQIVQLYQHKDDVEVYGSPRSCAPCPAIWVFSTHKIELTKQLQYYLWATNYNMPPQKVAAICGYTKAFCNYTGLGNPTDPRANWLQDEDIKFSNPELDKSRTCSKSVMTGTPGFSVMQMLRESVVLVMNALRGKQDKGFRHALTTLVQQNILNVVMMDGNNPPPLKPGRSYPQTLDEVNPDDYLYHPKNESDRHMFFAANIINRQGETVPFDHGATYDWMGDGMPYTWLPHISRRPIQYPMSLLVPLPLGAPISSPYFP